MGVRPAFSNITVNVHLCDFNQAFLKCNVNSCSADVTFIADKEGVVQHAAGSEA